MQSNIDPWSDGMRRQSTLSLAAAAYLLAGCNQPAVTPKAPDFQSSETTVRAWNDVALKIGTAIAADLTQTIASRKVNNPPIHHRR